MKILLRNGDSGYLSSSNEWLPITAGAMEFNSSADAVEYALRHDLGGVCVLLHFADSTLDIAIPISNERFTQLPV
jgi:hypothetical protein